MLFSKKVVLLILALGVCGLAVHAQVVSPSMLLSGKKELAAKGISEEELKAKLSEKGVNVASIKPEDLPGLQSTIEEAVIVKVLIMSTYLDDKFLSNLQKSIKNK